MSLKPIILTLPGRFSSGPDHWQSIWEAQRTDCSRIELGMWDSPQRNGWVNNINHAVRRYERPVFIAAHGLACIALAWWAALENPRWQEWIVGALLVAPTEAPIESDLESFGPTPRVLLPFPSILVASQNDPKVPFDRAQQLSRSWGSEFVSAGEAGHINACSNLGSWDFGQTLLSSLVAKAASPDTEQRIMESSSLSDRLQSLQTSSLWARDDYHRAPLQRGGGRWLPLPSR